MQRTDTLDFLIGHWRLVRLMSDSNGPLGVFEGRAAFVVTDEGLPGKASARCNETGILRPILSTCSVPAARRFLCRRLPCGPMELLFSDGRLITRVDLRSGSSHAEHWCGEDLQTIDTEVLSESWIQERWSVHGPDTEFEATTDFFRSMNEEE
jgi:hypothetical protein